MENKDILLKRLIQLCLALNNDSLFNEKFSFVSFEKDLNLHLLDFFVDYINCLLQMLMVYFGNYITWIMLKEK